MTKLPRPHLPMALALLFFVSAAHAQTPYPSLAFTREPNNEGSTDYLLKPDVDEIARRVGDAKPFQIIGVVARPTKPAAVLLFVNAQKELQLHAQTDMSVVITADSVEIRNLTYELVAKNESETDPLKLEIANVLINWKDFLTIARANSVLVKYGSVTYQLDKDNINALHYFLAEIEKDQKKTE
jgi:hypothetical protein